MDILYSWEISGIDGTAEDANGVKNIALAIHWICRGYLEDYPSISNNRQGVAILDAPTPDSFIDFENVSQEKAFEWLFSKVDKAKIESDIAESLSYADKLLAIKARTPLPLSWIAYPEQNA